MSRVAAAAADVEMIIEVVVVIEAVVLTRLERKREKRQERVQRDSLFTLNLTSQLRLDVVRKPLSSLRETALLQLAPGPWI